MTNEEVEYVLAAIEVVAKYGQRFLPLYDFDWKTGDWTFKHVHNLSFKKYGECFVDKLGELHGSLKLQQHKFQHCLRLAKAIAHLMPAFPPSRELREGVFDTKCLLFFL